MALPDAGDQARRFARVREAHRTEMQEDYVELIAELIAAHGEVRATDLAERLGVTSATVANTLACLKRDGLVEMRPYRLDMPDRRRRGSRVAIAGEARDGRAVPA